MNYKKHYDALIERAKNRTLQSYSEKHHIIPKCTGGNDSLENLVVLTPEEHYVAHQLLVKIYLQLGDKVISKKLLYALNLMSGKSNINRTNKYYGWIRRRVSESRKGYTPSKETLELISKNVKDYFDKNGHHNKGRQVPDSEKEKIRQSLLGRVITKDHRDKISAALKGKPKSESHRQKFQGQNNPSYKLVDQVIQQEIIDKFNKGKSILDMVSEYKFSAGKIESILRENNIDPGFRTCPHCGKTGQTSNMLRWHFNNCKSIQ